MEQEVVVTDEQPTSEIQETTEQENDAQSITPRGATAFVFIMLAFYAVYYLFSWFEIFVFRGA